MNCEICHNKAAETAIKIEKDGTEDELYVCRDCARKEKIARQKKSMRTRRVEGLPPGISMSVTKISEGDAPPFIKGLMNAIEGMISDIGKESSEEGGDEPSEQEKPKKSKRLRRFPCERVGAPYRIEKALHLEGLYLLGEIEAVKRAVRAVGMSLEGVIKDAVCDAGHCYTMSYTGGIERAKRLVKEIIQQERNARIRLCEERPRILGDSVCRSLAILKNCRLLSPGELFDMLSPLRLAAFENLIDGITLEEIEELLVSEHVMPTDELDAQPDEFDKSDGERADLMNRRFEDVVLSERGEEKFR